MSHKNTDNKNRLRSKTFAFRMSPQEAEQLDSFVRISGLNKQDYLISRVLQREIIVKGSPRTYKLLRDELRKVLYELKRLNEVTEDNDELLALIEQIDKTVYGFAANE